MKAPVFYTGEYVENDETRYTASLYLGESHDFVLREEIRLPNGKISSWEITGKWHQIRDRSFLQLTNKSSFYKIINVGSSGDLYCGMPIQVAKNITVILREKKVIFPEYTILGSIFRTAQGIYLKDHETDILLPVIAEKIIQDFLQEHQEKCQDQLYVEARVSVADEKKSSPGIQGLSVKKIKNIPELKGAKSYSSPQYFLDSVVDARWKLIQIGQNIPSSIFFLSFIPGKEKNNGKWELFDGSIHVTGSYTLQEQGISLSGNMRDVHLNKLMRQTKSWKLVGEVLELWDDTHILALLEKVH